MSLKPLDQPEPTQPEPETKQEKTEPKKKQSKTALAREIALKYTDLPYAAARDKVQEEAHTSKSLAHKSVKWAQNQKEKAQKKEGKATLKIIDEPDKTPEFLEAPPEAAPLTDETEPCLTPAEQPAITIVTEDQKEQLDLFRDMLRGTYVLVFSEDGILGKKYGRSIKQCEQLADQQYRWLLRRYSVEDLERFDTVLLVAAYGTFLGGIAKDYLAERRKKTETKA